MVYSWLNCTDWSLSPLFKPTLPGIPDPDSGIPDPDSDELEPLSPVPWLDSPGLGLGLGLGLSPSSRKSTNKSGLGGVSSMGGWIVEPLSPMSRAGFRSGTDREPSPKKGSQKVSFHMKGASEGELGVRGGRELILETWKGAHGWLGAGLKVILTPNPNPNSQPQILTLNPNPKS